MYGSTSHVHINRLSQRGAEDALRGRKAPYIAHYDGRIKKEWRGKRYYHCPMSCGMWPRRWRCRRWNRDNLHKTGEDGAIKASQGPCNPYNTSLGRWGAWCEVSERASLPTLRRKGHATWCSLACRNQAR